MKPQAVSVAVQPQWDLEKTLFPIERKAIKRALDGDVATMMALIQKWEIDAKILLEVGLLPVRQLSHDAFIKSQIIGRTLLSTPRDAIGNLESAHCPPVIIDNFGAPLATHTPYRTIFPQTYQAASILLAIAECDSIAALPHGMRQQTQLYSPAVTAAIPLDANQFNNESLHLAGVEVAIISSCYSHPAFISTLQRQGIKVFATGDCETVEEIQNTITQMGVLAHVPLKAELLNIFIDAALIAIDNWRHALCPQLEEEEIVVVNYCHQFSLISPRSLTYQMLKRMGIVSDQRYPQKSFIENHGWSIPIPEEKLVMNVPEQLIVVAEASAVMRKHVADKTAKLQTACTLVDATVQNTPSQYLVLAYYDLNEAVIDGYSEK